MNRCAWCQQEATKVSTVQTIEAGAVVVNTSFWCDQDTSLAQAEFRARKFHGIPAEIRIEDIR